MLLVMDIGNTNIKTGLFKDGRLQNSWRLRTDSLRTADEYGTQMEGFFGHLKIDTREVDGIIMSSVIPSMNYTMEHMCELYFHQQKVMVVNSEMNLGISIRYDMPSQLGLRPYLQCGRSLPYLRRPLHNSGFRHCNQLRRGIG